MATQADRGGTPPGVVEVARQATLEVLGACGIPPSLFLASSDGTAQRESFSRFLHTTLSATMHKNGRGRAVRKAGG